MKNVLQWVGTPAILAGIWFLCGVLVGNLFSQSLPFQETDPQSYATFFRAVLGAGAALTLLLLFVWYGYGSRKSVVMNHGFSKRLWWCLFIVAFLIGIGEVIYYSMHFGSEDFGVNHLIMVSLLTAFQTYVSFYLFSLFVSPTNVEYCVPGRKLRG